MEEISRQQSIQAAVSQVCYDDRGQKAEQKGLKNLEFGQKSASKTEVKEAVFVKEITASKEMLNTLLRNHRNNGLRATQKLARPYPAQAPGCKNSFEKRP